MVQHECVARFYDEHTQAVRNAGWPRTVGEAMKLASRMLEDGRQLSADYEKLQAELDAQILGKANALPSAHSRSPTMADACTKIDEVHVAFCINVFPLECKRMQIRDGKFGARRLVFMPPGQGFEAREQFRDRERLGQIVITAGT